MNDKRYGWPTTRRFPNTLADAFPNDPEYMQWWYPPEKKRGWSNAVMLVAGMMIWAGLIYWFIKG